MHKIFNALIYIGLAVVGILLIVRFTLPDPTMFPVQPTLLWQISNFTTTIFFDFDNAFPKMFWFLYFIYEAHWWIQYKRRNRS